MTRRALVIGGNSMGLRGIDRDVATMFTLLESYKFDVTRCQGQEGTREHVLDAFEHLIADSQSGDAAVIYYSGHGGQAINHVRDESQTAVTRPRYYQFLAPEDFYESRLGDFRGIVDIEFAHLLARLTARTRNVAVILDCCHAEATVRMSPLVNDRARKYNEWIVRHLEDEKARARDGGPGLARGLDHESNVHAIKLAACMAEQRSKEMLDERGVIMGVLTRELSQVLEASRDAPVTWAEVYQRVVARVRARSPEQWPQIDGPVHRRLFELDEAPVDGALALYHEVRTGTPWLSGGTLMGVASGDRYAVMPLGAMRADTKSALCMATVTEVEPDRARIELESGLPDSGPHDQAVASGRGVTRGPRSTVSRLEGARALPVNIPEPGHNAAIARALRSGTGPHALDAAFSITWGRVRDGRPMPAETLHGGTNRFDAIPTLTSGEHIYFEFCSPDRKSPKTYWSVLHIDTSGTVRLCTRSARSGVEITGNETYWLGARPGHGLRGLPMVRPGNTAPGAADIHTFVVIVTSRPVDFRALETAAAQPLQSALDTPPERLFEIAKGAKEPPMRGSSALQYAVVHLDFHVQ